MQINITLLGFDLSDYAIDADLVHAGQYEFKCTSIMLKLSDISLSFCLHFEESAVAMYIE